jgi:hypothetical protein
MLLASVILRHWPDGLRCHVCQALDEANMAVESPPPSKCATPWQIRLPRLIRCLQPHDGQMIIRFEMRTIGVVVTMGRL